MDNLFRIVSRIYSEMNSFIIRELEKEGYHDLHSSHGKILVNFMDSEKELNFKDLASKIGKSPQTMTTLIRTLEQKGYISLKKDPKDNRNKLVFITQKGRDFIPVMWRISEDLYKLQYMNIALEDQISMKSVLENVLNNFEVNHEG